MSAAVCRYDAAGNELLPPESTEELLAVLTSLYNMLFDRYQKHSMPDYTNTTTHLRRMCALLQQIMDRAQYRAVGRLLLSQRAQFDINKLFRPTARCRQKQYELDRDKALGLWQQAVNMAVLIEADEDDKT